MSLVHELCKLPRETEWVEFKLNYDDAQEIGEYVSALANSATLVGKAFAYVVWGVTDNDHLVVGTGFAPSSVKVGNEELENWLLHLLTPKIHFQFWGVDVDGRDASRCLRSNGPFAIRCDSRDMSSSASAPTRSG